MKQQYKKVLCVCLQGINRSVVLSSILKFKYDSLSMGTKTTMPETSKMLYDWADVIIVVEPHLKEQIPQEYHDKVKIYDVGSDRFPRPFNNELLDYFHRYLEQDPI